MTTEREGDPPDSDAHMAHEQHDGHAELFDEMATHLFSDDDMDDDNDNNDDDELDEHHDLETIEEQTAGTSDDDDNDSRVHSMDMNNEQLLDTENDLTQAYASVKPLEEHVLSQKLSQLSTVDHKQSAISHTVNEDIETTMPNYLAEGNTSFEQIIGHAVCTEMIEELRQTAILMYRFSMTHLQKSLWMAYLQSGTGKLKSTRQADVAGPHIWPTEMRQSMRNRKEATDDNACLTYVTHYLSALDDKIKQYQTALKVKISRLPTFIQTLETYVQQGLESARLEIEYHIALVQYGYTDRVLELAFRQHHPTDYQEQIAKRLCHAKYQEEITKQEFHLLKQRLANHRPHPPDYQRLLNTMHRQDVRQKQLYDEHRKVCEQANKDMMALYLSTAEAQMHHYRQQFNTEMKQFWNEQRTLPTNQKFTEIMADLITQRYTNVSESLNCVYTYKAQLIRLNSIDV